MWNETTKHLLYIEKIIVKVYMMNEISKNTELFVNILGMSRTSAVQKWDHETFQRAFRWANFFEQVRHCIFPLNLKKWQYVSRLKIILRLN